MLTTDILTYIFFSIAYFAGALLSSAGLDLLSGPVLMAAGIFMYFYFRKKYDSFLAPPALFSLSWIFCIGVASLKLSALQSVWLSETWIAFYLIWLLFTLGFAFTCRKEPRKAYVCRESLQMPAAAVFLLTVLSCAGFILEAAVLGFIPLFTEGTPHAYSAFHMSGVHYFTVLCVLVPSFSFLAFRVPSSGVHLSGKPAARNAAILFCTAVTLFLPVLMVSRYQLIFAVLLVFLCALLRFEDRITALLTRRNILLFSAVLFLTAALYLFLTVERAHSTDYLSGIFEMKNPDIPVLIAQPYIYIANNFENFNVLVRDLTEHTHGLRMAFPFFALTGLKFTHPELVSFPLYVTKAELTTVTLFYDAWYDFGTAGCAVFAAVLGAVYSYFYRRVRNCGTAYTLLIYAQLLGYLLLAFFTTWFSNPTTWFYFAACFGLYLAGLILKQLRRPECGC